MFSYYFFFIRKIILFLLAINFFYQGIKWYQSNKKITFSESTKHRFKCTSCQKEYTINGGEAKKKLSGAIKNSVQTPFRQTTQYKFSCPECQQYAFQEKEFDINQTKLLGNTRVQIDTFQIKPFKEFALKGILPMLIGMLLLG